jgi:hypothetical protein
LSYCKIAKNFKGELMQLIILPLFHNCKRGIEILNLLIANYSDAHKQPIYRYLMNNLATFEINNELRLVYLIEII